MQVRANVLSWGRVGAGPASCVSSVHITREINIAHNVGPRAAASSWKAGWGRAVLRGLVLLAPIPSPRLASRSLRTPRRFLGNHTTLKRMRLTS